MSYINMKMRGLTAEEVNAVSGGTETLGEIVVVGEKDKGNNQTWFVEQNRAPDLLCTYDSDAGSITCEPIGPDLAVNPPKDELFEDLCDASFVVAAAATGAASDNDWVGLGSGVILGVVQAFYCDK